MGYVRQWDDKKTHFEVIVGKSIPEEGSGKCFGLVQSYDDKPKRRIYEVLKGQGMQLNQQVVFLPDGGDTVRNLQLLSQPGSRTPARLVPCHNAFDRTPSDRQGPADDGRRG